MFEPGSFLGGFWRGLDRLGPTLRDYSAVVVISRGPVIGIINRQGTAFARAVCHRRLIYSLSRSSLPPPPPSGPALCTLCSSHTTTQIRTHTVASQQNAEPPDAAATGTLPRTTTRTASHAQARSVNLERDGVRWRRSLSSTTST